MIGNFYDKKVRGQFSPIKWGLFNRKLQAEAEREKNMIKFEQTCLRNGIDFKIHDDTSGPALEELKNETRFADLLVLSSELFYNQFGKQPNDYLKEVIHNSECPVVLLPEKYQLPRRNILCYDGSEASVFAIRQFAMTFPELCGNNTVLLCINKKEKRLPDQYNLEELVVQHFRDLTLFLMKEDPDKQFKSYIAGQANPMVVAGAYGRSAISELFKKSFISNLIEEHLSPIFIAHK